MINQAKHYTLDPEVHTYTLTTLILMFGGSTDPRTLSSVSFMLLRAIFHEEKKKVIKIDVQTQNLLDSKEKDSFLSSVLHTRLDPGVKLDGGLRVEVDLQRRLPSARHHPFGRGHHQAWHCANFLHLTDSGGRRRSTPGWQQFPRRAASSSRCSPGSRRGSVRSSAEPPS